MRYVQILAPIVALSLSVFAIGYLRQTNQKSPIEKTKQLPNSVYQLAAIQPNYITTTQQWVKYASNSLGIQFMYPETWKVEEDEAGITIKPPDWTDYSPKSNGGLGGDEYGVKIVPISANFQALLATQERFNDSLQADNTLFEFPHDTNIFQATDKTVLVHSNIWGHESWIEAIIIKPDYSGVTVEFQPGLFFGTPLTMHTLTASLLPLTVAFLEESNFPTNAHK